jgi:hypothetical protein|tara:strand:+ start:2651 stop:2932 length:282 start_codon:yes stop_codon:yes gene_type:complete
MIKVGDLVAVDSSFGSFIGIVNDRLEGVPWEWTVIECSTGDYVPCSTDEITTINSRSEADGWERKIKVKKILDRSQKDDTLLTTATKTKKKKR